MAASSIEALIEKLTAESVFEINWDGFVELSDRLKKAPGVHKDAINTLKKRLNSRDPHIVQNAIELLDFLWKNVTPEFRQEISSKKTIAELQAKATSAEAQTARKMREKIKQWAEEECKKDSSLSLIESLYRELAKSGYDFSSKDPSAAVAEKKRKEALLKEEEDRQLLEAIQQSLKVSSSPAATTKRSTASTPASAAPQTAKLEKQVRAVYDFPAAEDNEMSFNAGDVITVLDDSNPHWWKARLNGREGLIPAQFVEDIAAAATAKKENNPVAAEPVKVEIRAQINEDILMRTIEVLQQCDPSGLRPDPEGLDELEAASLAQAPLINEQLSQIDRLTNMLTKVDMSIRNALAEYDNAVQNSVMYQTPTSTMAYPQQHQMMPPNMPMQQQQMHQVQQHQQHQMPQQQQWNGGGQVPQGMMQQHQQNVSMISGPITSQQPPQPLHHPQQVAPSLHYTMAQQPPTQPIQSLTSQPYSTGY